MEAEAIAEILGGRRVLGKSVKTLASLRTWFEGVFPRVRSRF
jgi:hypothetical protein